MKKSHIDWCPVIPDHWEEKRIKDIAFLQSGNSITAMDIAEEGKYPVYGGNGLRGYTNNYTNDGDYVLIGRQGALCGNINYAYGKFYATEHAVVVYTKNEEITYWLGETLKAANLYRLSMTAAQPGLAVSTLNIQFIPYPPRKERIRIANYLAEKCTEIDHQESLLTSKRDAYLRLKKSIINHAVTRGLNPNVKMKDSGIEWIGEVPEHWEVKRLKNVVECNAKSLGENTPKDSIIKYVEISDVDHVHGINNIQSLMFGEAPSRARRITQKGDIIISTVRTYLKAIAKIEDDDIIVSTGFAVLHPTKCNGEYLAYYILSESFINRVEMLSKGTSYPAINASDLVSINVLIPPLPEQHAIATYLDDKCAKIDTIVSNLDKQISRYGDLKLSLIDEVITGKRAV